MLTVTPNAAAFEYVMRECCASPSQVRAAARQLGVDYHALAEDDTSCRALIDHFNANPTAQSKYQSEEDTNVMATTKTAAQPARKREGDTTRTAKRAAQEGISAAQVARDAGIDPRRFRAFLRSQGIARSFARKADATKAVKAFQKAAAE
jgi:hypothetical protein